MINVTATVIFLVVGVLLLVVEMFTPGLGVSGAAGMVSLFVAVMLQIGNTVGVLFMIALVLFLVAIAVLVFFRVVGSSRFEKSKIVLSDRIDGESTPLHDTNIQAHIGSRGIAVTPLRPAGKAVFDYTTLDVVTAGEFLPSGAEVEVTEVEGLRILVRALSLVPPVKQEADPLMTEDVPDAVL
ncbi:hypothetical protein LJC07_05270 [Christensenellaceae bacterium OttesenSCG-928-L17]|nr:hypothetical protein [Christensenellaceae bacterium OttesenSCG-928-L17]